MAGGFKKFGPTYKSTDALRVAYEGILNGLHTIDASNTVEELAGKFAKIGPNGVTLAEAGKAPVGLFREDLGDMVNASLKATFYFRGGEYYVNLKRTGITDIATIQVGDHVAVGAEGKLVKAEGEAQVVGVVTHVGAYKAGNMYEWATGIEGNYIGFILFV